MSIRASHIDQMLEDDDLVDAAADRMTEYDPEAPPSVNKARRRFAAADVRGVLRAVGEVMETRE